MIRKPSDHTPLRQRLDQICEGLQEGIRREIERRKRLGIPYYIAKNGEVVCITPKPHSGEPELPA